MLRHPRADHGLPSKLIALWKSRQKDMWGESMDHGSGVWMPKYSILRTLGLQRQQERSFDATNGLGGDAVLRFNERQRFEGPFQSMSTRILELR